MNSGKAGSLQGNLVPAAQDAVDKHRKERPCETEVYINHVSRYQEVSSERCNYRYSFAFRYFT
jgi:hypothetical protein